MLTYRDLCGVSQSVIASATCFLIGIFFSNLSYDSLLLFSTRTNGPIDEDYVKVLDYYQQLYATPRPLLYIVAFVAFLGIVGHLVRCYKPNPELSYFEYGSLVLYVLGVCVFITNIKTGIDCTFTHQWGEVTEEQGLAVLGSSNIILCGVMMGVLFLQVGLWYVTLDYERRMGEFLREEKEEREKEKEKVQKKKGKKAN